MVLGANPFISAYLQSDGLGKAIFWSLFLLSIASWCVLIHKAWIFYHAKRLSGLLKEQFNEKDPLGLQFVRPMRETVIQVPNPFFEVYKAVKRNALQMISRNGLYTSPQIDPLLIESDLSLIESHTYGAIAGQIKNLEKNLFLLSTIATLGPFIGLLGTVWGILLTFSQLEQAKTSFMNNTSLLSGLSLALATTVIGLLVAIPALVGYNYLKNAIREYRRDLEDFSHLLLAAIELKYRKPEHAKTTPLPL